jgi:hypothetical protein
LPLLIFKSVRIMMICLKLNSDIASLDFSN